MMTDDIKECKRIAFIDRTNKMVAAVHEMGHYLVAAHTTKSTILTVTTNYIEWLTNNGKWYGHTNITYRPIPPETTGSITFKIEQCKKQIAIGYAGKFAELAMFSKYDHTGYTKDQQMIQALSSQTVFFYDFYKKTAFQLHFHCGHDLGSVKPFCITANLLRRSNRPKN